MKRLSDGHSDDYQSLVGDLMASLLFLFILLLMTYILNFKNEEKQDEQINKARTSMLNELKKALDVQGVKIEIDEQNGLLRIPEREIRFKSGQATILNDDGLKGLEQIEKIKRVLEEYLPCFASEANFNELCKDEVRSRLAGIKQGAFSLENRAKLETVFIEGHSDPVPLRTNKNRYRDNYELSAARAVEVYRRFSDNFNPNSILFSLNNVDGRGIFSTAGYGPSRPLIDYNDYDCEKTDMEKCKDKLYPLERRIDIRLVMRRKIHTKNKLHIEESIER